MAVNNHTIIGRLGKDPEVKYHESGVTIASFSVAVSKRGYKKQDGTEVPEQTTWFNVTAFNQLAKIVESYLKKGMEVYISGEGNIREYEVDGVKKYAYSITAKEIQMFGGRQNSEQSDNNQSAPAQKAPAPTQKANADDDLPF